MTSKGYIIKLEDGKDKDYLGIKSAVVLIGSSREADYRLPISTQKQCHIWRKGFKTFLHNLDNTKILVNNVAVSKGQQKTLYDQNIITIEDHSFRYEVKRGNSIPTAPPHNSKLYNWRNAGAMPIHRPFSPGPIKKTKKKKRPSLKVKAAKLKNKSLATPTSSVSKKKKTKKTSKKRKASTSDSDSGPEDVINNAEEDIAFRAIDLLKELFTHLGPKLQSSLTQFHKTFVGNCLDKLHNHYNHYITIPEEVMIQNRSNTNSRVLKMCGVLKVLHKYITECDNMYSGERKLIPLHRACRGEHLLLSVRFNQPEGRTIEDVELPTHTHDTIGSVRRTLLRKICPVLTTNMKLDLYLNGVFLDTSEDRKMLSCPSHQNKLFLTGKLTPASSPESNSDSSSGSPIPVPAGSNELRPPLPEPESSLPGVLMSQNALYTQFLFQIGDTAANLGDAELKDSARLILRSIPADTTTVHRIKVLYTMLLPAVDTLSDESLEFQHSFLSSQHVSIVLDILTKTNFLCNSDLATKRAAYLIILKIAKFTLTVLGHIKLGLHELARLTQAESTTGSESDLTARTETETTRSESHSGPDIEANINLLKQVLHHSLWLPNSTHEYCVRNIGMKLSQVYVTSQLCCSSSSSQNVCHNSSSIPLSSPTEPPCTDCDNENTSKVLSSSDPPPLTNVFHTHITPPPSSNMNILNISPSLDTVLEIMRIIWAASRGDFELKSAEPEVFTARTNTLLDLCRTFDECHITDQKLDTNTKEIDLDDILVCKEALELLTVCLIMNDTLLKEQLFFHFLCDTLLLCEEKIIRSCVQEQLTLSLTLSYPYRNKSEQSVLVGFLRLLFPLLDFVALESRACPNSTEYIQLLSKLLNFISATVPSGPGSVFATSVDVEKYLNQELGVLKRLAMERKKAQLGQQDTIHWDVLLQGHLSIVKELVSFLSPEKKTEYGVTNELIKDLINDYLFPTTKLEKTGEINEISPAVLQSPESIAAGFHLLLSLCSGSLDNLKQLESMFTTMFYPDNVEPLTEWDYLPPIGPKPPQVFVGLKNPGATCYMNSVLQQLFMVDQIRYGILGAEGSIQDDYQDISSDESDNLNDMELSGETRREYNIEILKQIQIIFGYLEFSHLQYYIPKGLWRHFKLQGEPVNVREQQDAVEFFMNLIESLDEALKCLSQEQIMGKILGGLYSDQKICQECPHRYSKEEPFSVISVDIRNQCSLLDSLEQYVKGELLEGADAYMCDKCNKKVVTVKRLCVKKLPPILGIQLKRFEYDFERLCAIKFNDYFEFPRQLDMEPYTVKGLAKIEGEMIEDESEIENGGDSCTKYKLTGIVVHSGQASGGHYYSFILHRNNNTSKWYKFDDGDVSECKMDDDEEMKAQCFGGDYVGEIYDHMLKRVSVRKQKRWWNAYMLFYTRLDVMEPASKELTRRMHSLSLDTQNIKLPLAIERSVWRQNIKFIHDRNQFSVEYFNFMKQLATCNIPPLSHNSDKPAQGSEALSLLTVQLVSKFLFTIGFHTKKTLRGSAADWFECLSYHFRCYRTVRCWFSCHILFKHPHRFCEYLLACPVPEVRTVFMKILVYLAHYSRGDDLPPALLVPPRSLAPPLNTPLGSNPSLSDTLLLYVLSLASKELSEYGKHCASYFSLFYMYAGMGRRERSVLLRLNVPALFILIALDEGPGPPIKYQCPELSKLHALVIQLVRSCDVSFKCLSLCPGTKVLRNPYALEETDLQSLDVHTCDLLFNRNHYIKKLIDDAQISEDCLKFLQFLSWENPQMSKTIISELLHQIAFAYCHELRHYFDLLLGLLVMQDSWQAQSILLAMKGIDDERDGLFDTIQKSKSHYQKRAYQCMKCLTTLVSKCPLAYDILMKDEDLKKKWVIATYWLSNQLETRPSTQYSQYSYSNWSPPAIQSNETANGYFLERSNSAKKVLETAFLLCPTEEVTEREATDVSSDEEADEDSTEGEDLEGESKQGDDHKRRVKIRIRQMRSTSSFGEQLFKLDRAAIHGASTSKTTPLLPYDPVPTISSIPSPIVPYEPNAPVPSHSVPATSPSLQPYDGSTESYPSNADTYDNSITPSIPYETSLQYDSESEQPPTMSSNPPPPPPSSSSSSPSS